VYLLELARHAVDVYGSMQKPNELAAFLALVRARDPECVYEIGTATGGTLWALSRVTTGLLVSIDLPGGPFSGGATIEPEALHALIEPPGSVQRLVVLRGDSLTIELPPPSPDVIFIDGDHSAEGVRGDWARYRPLVMPGGFAAFHDILPHPAVTGVQVEEVWREIAADHETVEIVDPTPGPAGGQWGGIGIVHL
jgi:predicted O-methyltransferase YrrM